MYFEGTVSVNVTASENNWAPSVDNADVVRVASSGTWNITGIASKYRGKLIALCVVSGTIILINNSASSSVGNRFSIGSDQTMDAGSAALLFYDAVSSSWIAVRIPFIIASNSVSNSMLEQMPTLTVKGNNTSGTANVKDLSMSELRAILGLYVPVFKSADQNVTNSTTLVDASDLSFSVAANEKYSFRVRLFFKVSDTSAGAKYSITGPASPTVFEAHVYDFGEGTTETERHFGSAAYFTENITIGSGGATTGTGYAEIMGVFHNGANAGTLKIQFANVTAAGQTTTLRAGSVIEYKKI